MAFSQQASVTTSATRLDSPASADLSIGAAVVLYNPGPSTVFLGGSAVTTSTGLGLVSGASFECDLKASESLWGIVASGTQVVHVLKLGGVHR